MTSPYREAPLALECPRCAEMLFEVARDVSICAKCSGLWLGQRAIAAAVPDTRWPHGTNLWWRRELPCPVCAAAGGHDAMTLLEVGELMLDRCLDHGIWFDRGELARIIGRAPAPQVDALKAILESAKVPEWLIEEQKQREAASAAREVAEREAREERERELRRLVEARAEAAAREERDRAEKTARELAEQNARKAQMREELTKERDAIRADIEAITARVRTMRDTIALDEEKLRDLGGRLRTLDYQLAQLG